MNVMMALGVLEGLVQLAEEITPVITSIVASSDDVEIKARLAAVSIRLSATAEQVRAVRLT